MTSTDQGKLEVGKILTAILTTTAIIILPGIAWELFGWLHLLLPLLAFGILCKFGEYTGKKFLATATIISLICFLFLGNIDLFAFSAIFLFSGYMLFTSYQRGESVALSGFKTALTIGIGWSVVLAFFTWGSDISPYRQLITTLDTGISEALTYYRDSENVAPETMVMLESTLSQMKVIIPLIMPAILGSLILLVTWLTMLLGNTLVIRQNGTSRWQNYGYWQLPDKVIWLAIIMGGMTLLPVSMVKAVAVNVLILLSLVYSFQGLAVAVFYMNKWNVPVLMRSFFYVMMIVQTFGTIILLVIGIADVWLDLRKIKATDNPEEDTQ